jgi:hypothetical protein
MTSGECFENKWFYMKYIGKYLSAEILLTRECRAHVGERFRQKSRLVAAHFALY